MFCFDFCFPKATEAVNSKVTSCFFSCELIGYADLMIFREIWSEHSLIDKKQKGVGKFFCFKYSFRDGLYRNPPPPPGGGVLPYMGYIGMCGPKGYGFSLFLVINRVSILADFGHK